MFDKVKCLDFSLESNRERLFGSIAKLEKSFLKKEINVYPLINGKRFKSKNIIKYYSPNRKNELLANIHLASEKHAKFCTQVAKKSFKSFKNTSINDRIQILNKVSELISQNRFDLIALLSFSSGKTLLQADKEINDSIDFIRYYLSVLKLETGSKTIDEKTKIVLKPIGVVATISSYDNSFSKPIGMITSSLLSGNAVIFKPSTKATLVGQYLVNLFYKSGVPKDVLSFLPGTGAEIGDFLVLNEDVNLISFAGSSFTGLKIKQKLSNKKLITDLSGNNFLIVDQTADFKTAINSIIDSAFNHSGQKASSINNLIIHHRIYDKFLSKLIEAVSDLKTGVSFKVGTDVGPVIDSKVYNDLLSKIDQFSSMGKIIYKSEVPETGLFVPIAIFENVNLKSDLWNLDFGAPFLAVTKVKDFNSAVSIVNDSKYGLLSAIMTESIKNINYAANNLDVGNLFINKSSNSFQVSVDCLAGLKQSEMSARLGTVEYFKLYSNQILVSKES